MNISYCTNCHKRLWQLKLTLPENLKFTKKDEIDIVVLAYNDATVKPYLEKTYPEYIADGRLKVFEVNDGKEYQFGVVKNLVHNEATGRVLFNLDADNFITGTPEKLATLKDDEILISHLPLADGRGGRIGVTKTVFDVVGGYRDGQADPDDVDFIKRVKEIAPTVKYETCPRRPLPNKPPKYIFTM